MKTSLTKLKSTLFSVAIVLGFMAHFSNLHAYSPPHPASNTVVDIIVGSEDHTTLEAAVLAANLAGTLSGDGPFTVFAPTDAAFATLPDGTLDALLADPSGALTDILLYHVIGAEVMAADLSDGQMDETLFGKDITVSINTEGVFINDAKVTVADIMTDNGVVHVIDMVLTPPVTTVVDIIVGSEDHTTLKAAVLAANLASTLSGDGPFTVFAPTDAAFATLPDGTLDALLADPSGALTDILLYHVIGAEVMAADLSDGQMDETLFGKDITVSINTEGVFINDAKVTVADIMTDNGVVHVIDMVLIYEDQTTAIKEFEEEIISVFPNPTSDFLRVNFNDEGQYNMNLYSIEGRLVRSFENINRESTLNVSDVRNGTYFLTKENQNLGVKAIKIIISR